MTTPFMTTTHPAAAGLDFLAEIALHSAALADAAETNLDAPVEHCPGWRVADLVHHVFEVHWFWSTIVERRLTEPPESGEPERPAEAELVAAFRRGALHLVEVLHAADPATPCWTWAASQQNAGFVLRHQVQEAAVHRWDAEHAAGRDPALGVALSVDSIEEFLSFSVADPSTSTRQLPPLAGAITLEASDAAATWTVSDRTLAGARPPGVDLGPHDGEHSRVSGTASDLLLWLYRRKELPASPASSELFTRFRALTFTD